MYFGHTNRKTVKRAVSLKGVGLHSGTASKVTIRPAQSGAGITFYSSNHTQPIKADISSVIGTNHAVTLGNDQWTLMTVEHLMAAFAIHGVTDARVDISGEEVPIMDGSARPFIEAIRNAGLRNFRQKIEPIVIQNPVWIMEGDKYLIVLPSTECRVSYTIEFDHPSIKTQSMTVSMDPQALTTDVMAARTFGFLEDVEKLKAQGLALGGSEDNAIIFTRDGYLNESLRYEDECIRHKVLDLVGDISLLGRPVIGHFIAHRGGHSLDVELCRKIQSIVDNNQFNKSMASQKAGLPLPFRRLARTS